ncbi:HEAT repeat domain-containing protein [Streptomyces lincolnensis]|uniref:HEAT repeat domain-containing protein n=1 Tax=Streptomyces lincolnensis TaxID=1915 RepID=UPI001E4524BC|nr:HEAT repeat domain-containing protein [Streptomyces lincolnensis]MCD7445115.1 HEAT repeat domain-containing protein [Streptomyces lincolnensis]
MRVVELSAEALDAVPWQLLESADPNVPAKEVRRVLRRLVRKGPESTEPDCRPLFSALADPVSGASSLGTATLPFVVALAADPRTGARRTLVELLVHLSRAPDPAETGWAVAWEHARDTVPALLADPDPGVRREAVPLADGVGPLLWRWRTEPDPTVRLPVLFALGDVAADAEVRTILTGLLRDSDPVLRVAAVHALARREPQIAVRELDSLVRDLTDPAVRSRWEAVWYVPDVEEPFSREDVAHWTAALFEGEPATVTRFLLGLAGAADPAGDADLLRTVMEWSWRSLTSHRSVEAALLPLAGGRLDHADAEVRLTAAHVLAAAGPRAAAYADRLAALLDDPGEGVLLDGTVGEHARWALARMDDPRALPGLVESLCTPYREELGRSWAGGGPRRPEIVDVLGPLRAHADVLLPTIRAELRREDAPRTDLLAVVEVWGPDALPALPEVMACVSGAPPWHAAAQALAALGPAAACAAPVVRERLNLEPPENRPWLRQVLRRIGAGDPEEHLRAVGESLPVEGQAPDGLPVGGLVDLIDLGPRAAPYADRVRYVLENSEGWTRRQAAIALWSITGETESCRAVLEEEILEFAADREYYGVFDEALRALIRLGPPSPAVRTALRTLRDQDARLSPYGDYRAILDDEKRLALIDEALSSAGPPDEAWRDRN